MGNGRRKFDREFKQEAVRLVAEQGKSVAEVARDLGICETVLHRWKKQSEEDPDHAFPGKGRQKPQDEELRRLKKEVADLRIERDILKKALAIFSRGAK